jgi:hypothetical protein
MSSTKSKPKRGRPSKFDAAFIEQAHKLALMGATDKQMAEFWGVSEQTLNAWKTAHPEFLESLKAGKLVADGNVAQSLYRRANGYSHQAVKIFMPAGASEPVYADYTEHYPPDATSAIFWLKNRQPAIWRDKVDVEQKHSLDTEALGTTPLELARGLAFVLALAQREAGASTAAPAAPPIKH